MPEKSMLKIKTILIKEWAEVFKNKMVIFSVIFMPLLFTALPLIFLFATRDAGATQGTSDLPAQFSKNCPPELTNGTVPGPLAPAVDMSSVEKSSSGAWGAKACHARVARAASNQGQTTW